MKKLELLSSDGLGTMWYFVTEVKSNVIHEDGVYFYDEFDCLVASIPKDVAFRVTDKN